MIVEKYVAVHSWIWPQAYWNGKPVTYKNINKKTSATQNSIHCIVRKSVFQTICQIWNHKTGSDVTTIHQYTTCICVQFVHLWWQPIPPRWMPLASSLLEQSMGLGQLLIAPRRSRICTARVYQRMKQLYIYSIDKRDTPFTRVRNLLDSLYPWLFCMESGVLLS